MRTRLSNGGNGSSSGSGFIDNVLRRGRKADPDIDPQAEIIPGWKRTRDLPIIPPGQLGGEPKGGSFKRGGKVKKTGLAKVHKGERVLTAKQAKAHARATPKRAALKRKARK